MATLVWRVKLVADLGSGIVSETEVARIERDDFAVAETVGLRDRPDGVGVFARHMAAGPDEVRRSDA